MTGCALGMIVVYTVDHKYLHFETKAVWWAQILKAALGLGLVLAVKEGLKVPLEAIFGGHMIARAIRYFALVLFAGIRERLDMEDVPKAMRGVPIALIAAGLLAMAFMGFANVVSLP